MYINLDTAIRILKENGIVAFPTETVYGLGAIATNELAVGKIFKAKNRPMDNPLICHFDSVEHIEQYVEKMPLPAKLLLKFFSPGPLSVVLSLHKNSPLSAAVLGRDSVVCRIPDHPFALEIIKSVGLPIAAPSANTSGRMSATTAEMVEQDLGDKIDGIIDGGASRVGIESTIVDGRNTQKITILRPGIIGKLELEKFFQEAYKAGELSGLVGVEEFSKHISTEIVPGSKYRHYAPRTPLYEIKQLEDITDDGMYAVIATKEQLESIGVFDKKIFKQGNIHYLCVGSRNSLEEIVKNMYNIFFVLDTLSLSKAYILTEEWGTSSLAKALENRLRKVLL